MAQGWHGDDSERNKPSAAQLERMRDAEHFTKTRDTADDLEIFIYPAQTGSKFTNVQIYRMGDSEWRYRKTGGVCGPRVQTNVRNELERRRFERTVNVVAKNDFPAAPGPCGECGRDSCA